MKSLLHFALVGAACLALCACGRPEPVDPAANDLDDLPANVVADADSQRLPQAAPPITLESSPTSRPAIKEPRMPKPDSTTSPPPVRPTPSPPVRAPVNPPRPVILPSPTQPPAEVDPAHVYPGDEVPR